MSNKKTVLAAAVALAIVAYAGTTWYTGQRAQAGYQNGVAELRKVLGEQAVVADEYQKGFFSSTARLVLQWTPPAREEGEGEAAAARPLRLVVDSSVRHGPLAGARLAAAVMESHFALEGLDEKAVQALSKATGPTLTSVHHFLGGNDVRLLLPAGEIGDGETALRWQEMVLDTALSSGNKRIKGSLRWPEVAITGLPGKGEAQAVAQLEEGEEEGDADDGSAQVGEAVPANRTNLTFTGLESQFDNQPIDGLWAMGPGTASIRVARMGISSVPAAGGEASTLLDLKDLVGSSVIESDSTTLGMTTQVKGAGRIGPIDFDSLGYEEKIQRLDIEALRSFQNIVVEGYRSEGLAKAFKALESQGRDMLMQNAPRLVAALPAYSMKLHATYQGQTGQLEYGAEVQSAPSTEQVAAAGWGPALLKTSALHADARLPKAWLEPLLKAKSGGEEVKPEEVDAMLGMAQATGYARLEGDHLTSALKMQGGQMTLNGKPIPLPMGALQ